VFFEKRDIPIYQLFAYSRTLKISPISGLCIRHIMLYFMNVLQLDQEAQNLVNVSSHFFGKHHFKCSYLWHKSIQSKSK